MERYQYCNFYRIILQSPIEYFCDNKEVIQKLLDITESSRHYYSSNSKIKDLDAVLEIQKYIPANIKVHHVRGHQDKKKRKEQLTMAEKLNIMADKIIGKNATNPKPLHIQNIPMAVYIQKKDIPNNIRKEIRAHCGAQEAASFLKEKYKWKQQTLDNIE